METASEQIAAGGRNTVTIDPPTTPRVSVESRRIDEPRVCILYTRTTVVRALDQTDLTGQIKSSQLYNDIFFPFLSRRAITITLRPTRSVMHLSCQARTSVKASKRQSRSDRVHGSIDENHAFHLLLASRPIVHGRKGSPSAYKPTCFPWDRRGSRYLFAINRRSLGRRVRWSRFQGISVSRHTAGFDGPRVEYNRRPESTGSLTSGVNSESSKGRGRMARKGDADL